MKKYLIITTLATMCLSFSCTSMEDPEKLSHQDPAEQLGTKAYGDKLISGGKLLVGQFVLSFI